MIRTVDLPLKFPEHLLKPDTVLDLLLHLVLPDSVQPEHIVQAGDGHLDAITGAPIREAGAGPAGVGAQYDGVLRLNAGLGGRTSDRGQAHLNQGFTIETLLIAFT